MISATEYRLTCDHPGGCGAEMRCASRGAIRRAGMTEGWTFSRKLDGERAIRGGKDHCPKHRRPNKEVSRG